MRKLQDQLEQTASNIQKSIAAYEQAGANIRTDMVSIQQYETI
jgi:hypothetical protein